MSDFMEDLMDAAFHCTMRGIGAILLVVGLPIWLPVYLVMRIRDE